MFETIGNIISVAIWISAILGCVGWVVCVIQNFTSGNGWKILKAVVSIILGAIVFKYSMNWLSSIAWAMMFGGGVGFGIAADHEESGMQERQTEEKRYGVTDAFLDAYIEQKMLDDAVEKALRNKKWD